MRKSRVLVFLFAAASVMLQAAVNLPPHHYLGFEKLTWVASDSCKVLTGPTVRPNDRGRATVRLGAERAERASCVSDWFPARGNTIAFYYFADYTRDSVSRAAVRVNSHDGTVGAVKLHALGGDRRIRRYRFSTDAVPEGTPLQVEIRASGKDVPEFGVLNRLEFSWCSHFARKLHERLTSLPGRLAVSLILAVALIALLLQISGKTFSGRYGVPLLFFAATFAVQFRLAPYFFQDEWFFLNRYDGAGFSAAILTHNEHFIPVFGLLYGLEYELFHGQYAAFIFVSVLLQAVSGYLLAKVLRGLGQSERTALAAGLLFVVSGSQLESIQWVLCQSSVLAVMFALLASLAFIRCSRSGSFKDAASVGTFGLLSAFSFGGAFAGLAGIPFLVVLQTGSEPGRRRNHRIALTALIVGGLFALGAYEIFRSGFKHAEVNRVSASTLEILDFVSFGSIFGTLLRGSGLFPFAYPQPFYASLGPETLRNFFFIRSVLSTLGALVSVSLLLLYRKRSQIEPQGLRYWAVGHIWIILPMLLVGLGRAQLGDEYAGALRYQAFPLLGLILVLTPLLSGLCAGLESASRVRRVGAAAVFCALFAAQIHIGMAYDYFSRSGRETTEYLQREQEYFAAQDPSRGSEWQPLLVSENLGSVVEPDLPPAQLLKLVGE